MPPFGQPPQSSVPPHPSPIVLQYRPPLAMAQLIGTQLGPPTQRPALQTSAPEQPGHSSLPPGQPFPIVPQYRPVGGM